MPPNNPKYLYKTDQKVIQNHTAQSNGPDIQKALINLFKLYTNKPYGQVVLNLAAYINDKDKAAKHPDDRLYSLTPLHFIGTFLLQFFAPKL